MSGYLTIVDFILIPVLLMGIYVFATSIKHRHIENNKAYRYYIPGLMVKLTGAIAICLTYVYYFKGGDTIGYHDDCVILCKAFIKSPYEILRLTFLGADAESYSVFDHETGFP